MKATSRYQLGNILGRRGVSDVLEAYAVGEQGFRRRVVVRRLRPEFAQDKDTVQAFMKEASFASQLHQANVVSVLDVGMADGLPFLVLEWVDGLDAAAALKKTGPMPAGLALHLAGELAHGLADAHDLGIVHRNIKPENVLLSFDGNVLLSDFGMGLAIHHARKNNAEGLENTQRCMAPEQRSGPGVDARADIFALGCVLHTFLTARSPLETEAMQARFFQRQQTDVDPDLPKEVGRIIHRATKFHPEQRYGSAVEMAQEIGRALKGRLQTDGRSAAKAYLQELRPKSESSKAPLDDLFDIGGLLGQEGEAQPTKHILVKDAAPPEVAVTRVVKNGSRPRLRRFVLLGLIGILGAVGLWFAVRAGVLF